MEQLNPSEYFEQLKDKKKNVTDADLDRFYDNAMTLLAKAQKTKQTDLIRKLIFIIDCIEKERELVKAGINTFVYRDDVTEYIKNVAKKVVKIIELEKYPREIPDEIADVVENYGHLFDKLYVVFTDYTGEIERKVEKERRDKDPILFGAFELKNNASRTSSVSERFYFLGDWIDDYCDLTLEKMVYEMKSAGKGTIKHKVATPEDLDDIRKELAQLDAKEAGHVAPVKNNGGFFKKIKTFLIGD
jgi:hypothetical protein